MLERYKKKGKKRLFMQKEKLIEWKKNKINIF